MEREPSRFKERGRPRGRGNGSRVDNISEVRLNRLGFFDFRLEQIESRQGEHLVGHWSCDENKAFIELYVKLLGFELRLITYLEASQSLL